MVFSDNFFHVFDVFAILHYVLLVVEQDMTSFFSVQLTENTIVAHNGTINFNRIIVNFGADYIQSGGIYV